MIRFGNVLRTYHLYGSFQESHALERPNLCIKLRQLFILASLLGGSLKPCHS